MTFIIGLCEDCLLSALKLKFVIYFLKPNVKNLIAFNYTVMLDGYMRVICTGVTGVMTPPKI